jgi:hypothetical protein
MQPLFFAIYMARFDFHILYLDQAEEYQVAVAQNQI